MMTLNSNHVPEVSCRIANETLARLATVLQSGFFCEARTGDSFLNFLVSLPGFTKDYIANDVGTVFLNGDAMDDMDIPLSGTSVTIALSAAMPGLCGTILRKGSPHAALRKTHVTKPPTNPDKAIQVKVKLFNTIATERGPRLFQAGVYLRSADLLAFLSLRPSLVEAIQDIVLSGTAISREQLLEHLDTNSNIFIKAA